MVDGRWPTVDGPSRCGKRGRGKAVRLAVATGPHLRRGVLEYLRLCTTETLHGPHVIELEACAVRWEAGPARVCWVPSSVRTAQPSSNSNVGPDGNWRNSGCKLKHIDVTVVSQWGSTEVGRYQCTVARLAAGSGVKLTERTRTLTEIKTPSKGG